MKHTLISKALILLLTLIIICMFLNTGCNVKRWDVAYVSHATGDGAGGAIVLYDIIKSSSQRDFYAQKISTDGQALWGERGVLIGSGNGQSFFFELQIVSDGAAGAIISLEIYSPSKQRTYITRVGSEGKILWQKEITVRGTIMDDGNGGCIIADTRGDRLLFLKIDSEGTFPWGEGGVFIDSRGYQDNSLQLTGDGAGGAIILCQEDVESSSGTEGPNPVVEHHIVAQKIDSRGAPSWGQDNVTLYATRENVYINELRLVSDDSGGVIAVWSQGTPDIYAQRLDADGNIMWQANGVPLGISRPIVAGSDGSGGAIIAWEKTVSGIFVQRVDADGNVIWQPRSEGILPAESGWSVRHDMVVDEFGGAIVTLSFRDDMLKKQGIRLHKLDSAGNTVWQVNDIGVDVNDMGVDVRGITGYFVVPDGEGGAIVFWGIGQTSFSAGKSYIQRIDSNGKLLWGERGIRLDH